MEGIDRVMHVTVQWVRTQWSKASRGGPAAARRNALPLGLLLPEATGSIRHEVTMREADGFTVHESVGELRLRPREFVVEAGRLLVRPPLIPVGMDNPRRARRPPGVRIAPGEWLRWRLNHRVSSMAGMADWSYHLHTLNVACGPVPRDVFLGEPPRHVDELLPLR